jgi:hypothetical protein
MRVTIWKVNGSCFWHVQTHSSQEPASVFDTPANWFPDNFGTDSMGRFEDKPMPEPRKSASETH